MYAVEQVAGSPQDPEKSAGTCPNLCVGHDQVVVRQQKEAPRAESRAPRVAMGTPVQEGPQIRHRCLADRHGSCLLLRRLTMPDPRSRDTREAIPPHPCYS